MKKKKTKDIPVPQGETQEQKQARVDAAGEMVRKVLEQYHVALVVSNLNIESGRILPTIEVVAKDLPI